MTDETLENRKAQLRKANEQWSFAGHADAVLNNPAFVHAIQMIKADRMSKFQATTFEQKEEREELWRQMKTIADFEQVLTKTMQSGPEALRKIGKLEKLIKSIVK